MPKSVKTIIVLTCVVSLLTPLLSFFLHHFGWKGPIDFLPLTLEGVKQGQVWQLLSYFFVQSSTLTISLSLFISLFFFMFLLGFAAKEIALRFGAVRFLLFYLLAGVLSGAISLAYLAIFPRPYALVGPQAPIFASLVVWVLLHADLKLSYFFLIQVKAKWLVGLIFAIPLLIHLSTGDLPLFFNEAAGIVFGYIVGRYFFKLRPLFHFRTKKSSKIVDIDSYISEDETFKRLMETFIVESAQNCSVSPTRKPRD